MEKDSQPQTVWKAGLGQHEMWTDLALESYQNSAAYQLCVALSGATLWTGLFLGQEIRTARERVCKITIASKASIQAQLEERSGDVCISFWLH